MLLYYITGRNHFTGTAAQQAARTLAHIHAAARAGVDMIQLREKDFTGSELQRFAHEALRVCRQGSSGCKLLVNSRADIALAEHLDGVHLNSNDISPADVRLMAGRVRRRKNFDIGISCHNMEEVIQANSAEADFVVFGPVFEKEGGLPQGLEALAAVCKSSAIPVLALGGITPQTVTACVDAGAAGIAGIRLFQFDGELNKAELLLKMRVRVRFLQILS